MWEKNGFRGKIGMTPENSVCVLERQVYYYRGETPYPNANWKGKGSFRLLFPIIVHHQSKSKQELKCNRHLEVGDNSEAISWCSFLACSTFLAQSAFL